MGGILVIECKVLEYGLFVVGCGLCSLEEFQNLVPELVCLVIWFQILIMLKVSSFGIFKSGWFTPENSQK